MEIDFQSLNQPDDEDYLWRYVKPERIDSLIRGEIYFSSLLDFQDQHEALDPMHFAFFKFLTINADTKFDLQTSLAEQDIETVTGTIMMWLALYDLEKKLTTLGLIKETREVQPLIEKYLGNPSLLHDPHVKTLTRFYSSCWFVGNFEESALMWTSYSQPGGIAIRIKFSDFKEAMTKYFTSQNEINSGIKTITSGLINYIDQDGDFEEWNHKIESGIPLPFFKQNHFKEEREYRILLDRDISRGEKNFNRLYTVFKDLNGYEIILHPSSWHDEFLALKNIIPNEKRIRLSLSKIRFNK